MQMENSKDYAGFAEAFAFLGNSLMEPPLKTGGFSVDPSFWEDFPTFESAAVCGATASLVEYLERLASNVEFDPVTDVSVEFTRLFVGPPSPGAAPWETMYRGEGTRVGFGAATFEMRELMRGSGLQVSGDSNQYEDHMGIELLYLSVLCRKVADGEEIGFGQISDFIEAHPGAWIEKLSAQVAQSAPDGYYVRFLALCSALLAALLDGC